MRDITQIYAYTYLHTHTQSHNVENISEANLTSHSMCKGSKKPLFIAQSLQLADMQSKAHTHKYKFKSLNVWYNHFTSFLLIKYCIFIYIYRKPTQTGSITY